jgi:hypothetical protein
VEEPSSSNERNYLVLCSTDELGCRHNDDLLQRSFGNYSRVGRLPPPHAFLPDKDRRFRSHCQFFIFSSLARELSDSTPDVLNILILHICVPNDPASRILVLRYVVVWQAEWRDHYRRGWKGDYEPTRESTRSKSRHASNQSTTYLPLQQNLTAGFRHSTRLHTREIDSMIEDHLPTKYSNTYYGRVDLKEVALTHIIYRLGMYVSLANGLHVPLLSHILTFQLPCRFYGKRSLRPQNRLNQAGHSESTLGKKVSRKSIEERRPAAGKMD